MDVQQLLASFQKTAAVEEAKAVVASVAPIPQTDPNVGHDKLASDIYAAGALFGEGFTDRVLEKLASSVAAGGAGPVPTGKWGAVSQRIAAQHTMAKPGDPPATAEKVPGAMSGSKAVVNPTNYPA